MPSQKTRRIRLRNFLLILSIILFITIMAIIWFILDKSNFSMTTRKFHQTELHDKTNEGAIPGSLKWKE